MKFTTEQVNEVVKWMQKWEKLHNTVIPIRFREDFETEIKTEFSEMENLKTRVSVLRGQIQRSLKEFIDTTGKVPDITFVVKEEIHSCGNSILPVIKIEL